MPHNWTGQDVAAALGGLAVLLTAIAGAAVKILMAVRAVHKDINSRMDQLVDETRKASLAEGREQMRSEAIIVSDANVALGRQIERDSRSEHRAEHDD